MINIVIVGGGAFARELVNWFEHADSFKCSQKLVGFLDDSNTSLGAGNYNLPHLGSISEYLPEENDLLLMAISDVNHKKIVFNRFKSLGAKFSQFIHPTAVVASSAMLGEGVVICPFALVSADAFVGDVCAINVSSSVGHDVSLGHFSTLSSHVDLTGWVQVGERVFFGSWTVC